MKTHFLFLILSFFFTFFPLIKAEDPSPSSTDHKDKYDIIWVRPYQQGQIYFMRVHMNVRYETKTQLNKQPINSKLTMRDIYYTAKVTVLEINEKTTPSKEKHEVLSFYEINQNKKINLISKGNTLIIQKGNTGKEILLNDKTPEKDLFSILNQIIEINIGGPTYNEMLGIVKNVTVHSEWDILKQNILSAYKGNHIAIEPTALAGTVIFEKAEENRLTFSGKFTINPFPTKPMADRILISSKYTWSLSEIAPVDTTQLPHKVKKVTEQTIVDKDKNSDIEIETEIKKEHLTEYFSTSDELEK